MVLLYPLQNSIDTYQHQCKHFVELGDGDASEKRLTSDSINIIDICHDAMHEADVE